MGIDFLEYPNHLAENQRQGRPQVGVGANSVIERAIIDKNARIGRNVKVINDRGTLECDEHSTHVIRDGIVVIPKSTVLADGTLI